MQYPHPTLLLLPGLEGSGDLFSGLIDELAPHFDIQVVRYPNSCGSYAAAAAVVREMLPPNRPVVLVAESFSTPLAVQIAAEAPQAIAALVLCNGFILNPLTPLESMWAAAAAPWWFQLPLTNTAARTFLVGPDASDTLVRKVQSAIAPLPPSVLCARLHAVLRCDAQQALAHITAPMLYLHATRDRLTGHAGLKQMLSLKPDLAVERMVGPHLLLQKEPRTCADLIRRFLETATASPQP